MLERVGVFLEGPQASGKDYLARELKNDGFTPFGAGDILRKKCDDDPEFDRVWGDWVHCRFDDDDPRSPYLPDEVINPLFEPAYRALEGKVSFNGIPRSVGQAESIIPILSNRGFVLITLCLTGMTVEAAYGRVKNAKDRGNRHDDRNFNAFARRFREHEKNARVLHPYLKRYSHHYSEIDCRKSRTEVLAEARGAVADALLSI